MPSFGSGMPSDTRLHTFAGDEKLSLQADFKAVFSKGSRVRSGKFDVRYLPKKDSKVSRLGLSVSRAAGLATVRNTLKRKTREWFRLNKHRLKSPVDLVFCLRSPFSKADILTFPETIEAMLKPILTP